MKVIKKTVASALIASAISAAPMIAMAQTVAVSNSGQVAVSSVDSSAAGVSSPGQAFVLQTSPRLTSQQAVVFDGEKILPAEKGGYIVASQVPGGAVISQAGSSVDGYQVVDETVMKQGADFIKALGGDPRMLYRYVTVYSSDPNSSTGAKSKTVFVFKTEKVGGGFGTTTFKDNAYITYTINFRVNSDDGEYVRDKLHAFYKTHPEYHKNLYIQRTSGAMYKYSPGSQIVEGDKILFGPAIPKDKLPK